MHHQVCILHFYLFEKKKNRTELNVDKPGNFILKCNLVNM